MAAAGGRAAAAFYTPRWWTVDCSNIGLALQPRLTLAAPTVLLLLLLVVVVVVVVDGLRDHGDLWSSSRAVTRRSRETTA